MKRFLFSLIFLICVGFAQNSSFAPIEQYSDFEKLAVSKKWAEAINLIESWKKDFPNDPEWRVALANYYVFKATTNKAIPAKRSDWRPEYQYDTNLLREAISVLTQATNAFPNRLDIWFGLAHLHREAADYKSHIQTLSDAMQFSIKNMDSMVWLYNKPLPSVAEKYIPETLHAYASYFYKWQSTQGEEYFFQIATIATTCFPSHVYGLNDLALYYLINKKYEKAMPILLKALEITPDDIYIKNNIANCYVQQKEYQKARIIFEEIIRNSRDTQTREKFEKKLKEIEGI